MVGPLDHAKTLGKYHFTIKTCKDEFLFWPCNRVRRGLDSIWFTSTFFLRKSKQNTAPTLAILSKQELGMTVEIDKKNLFDTFRFAEKQEWQDFFSCSKIFNRTGSTSLTKQMSIAIFHWTWKLIAGMSIFMLST